ncbi:MAG: hypothetical protein WA749_07240 [Gelidibacter sp.]
MKKTSILFVLGALILQSCSPKIRANLSTETHQALDSETQILIIKPDEKVPENSIFVGDLKIGDSGFSTDCGYTKVMDEAKSNAKNSGANLIHLTEVKKPNLGSTCYRIKAKLYRNLNQESLVSLSEKRTLETKSRLPADADYAVIHFYRPKSSYGAFIGFKIRKDDADIIGRVRNGEKFTYQTKDFGPHEFWGLTESRSSVIIDVKKGEEYFVRCGITMGIAVGKPEIYSVDNDVGISEFESIKDKKKQ